MTTNLGAAATTTTLGRTGLEIVGARCPSQLQDWIGAGAVELDGDRLDEIAALLEATGAGAGPTRPGGA